MRSRGGLIWIALSFSLMALFCTAPANAEWSHDSGENNLLAGGDYDVSLQASISDGANGFIIVYKKSGDLYAQRFDPDGRALWNEGGVMVYASQGYLGSFILKPNGSGGALLLVRDSDNGGVAHQWAQKIISDGTVLWGSRGVKLAPGVTINIEYADIVEDGRDGAFVVWCDDRDYNNYPESVNIHKNS